MSAAVVIVLIIVVGLAWAFTQQLRLARELRGEVEQLEHAVATQQALRAYLTATLEYVQTDEYVEQFAREEAKMAKPGEVVMIPVLRGGSERAAAPPPEPPEEAATVSEDRPFWAVWWEALFGPGS
jgi:cell division protein FtsB